jgi:hypothetical protein
MDPYTPRAFPLLDFHDALLQAVESDSTGL